MHSQATQVMTIANSIIGVSILAMPYCFKQCGIILSILILIVSSIISRLSCHLLLKSAIMARRRTFEFLAFHAFGSLGKFIIEVGLIGFLLGTCIAFFVIMGDLGPAIVAKMTDTQATDRMRTTILMVLALFCVLPLGLLRNIDSLSSVCTATIVFYFCLVLKIVVESLPHIFSGDWLNNVEMWRPIGILQCLPIFSMALFCQTQIFEIYQVIPNASLEKMNDLIRKAVNICTGVYIFVGTFGYIAFASQMFTGNILMSFSPSFMSDLMKIGFVLSVAFSFPLIIFPCRASLYSLLYKQLQTYSSLHDSADKYIPEGRFKGLTFLIVFVSFVIGVMIPNIELVLGLVGSTIGIMICVLFPATCFICISSKNTNERVLAQIMLFIGIIVMVLGTYANLYAMEELASKPVTEKVGVLEPDILKLVKEEPVLKIIDIPSTTKPPLEAKLEVKEEPKEEVVKEVRHEPPQPIEPAEVKNEPAKEDNPDQKPVENNQSKDTNIEIPVAQSEAADDNKKLLDSNKLTNLPDKPPNVKEYLTEAPAKKPEINENAPLVISGDEKAKNQPDSSKAVNKKIEEVDIEAIRKEEKELLEQEKENLEQEKERNLDLIKNLKEENEANKKLVEDSKKILEEIKQAQQAFEQDKQQKEIDKVKQEKIKQIGEIAKKAIEKISANDDSDKHPNSKQEEPKKLDAVVENKQNSLKPSLSNTNNEVKTNNVMQNVKGANFNMVPLPIVKSNFSLAYKNVSGFQNLPEKINQLVDVAQGKAENQEVKGVKLDNSNDNKVKMNNQVKIDVSKQEQVEIEQKEKSQINSGAKEKKKDQINILDVLRTNAEKVTILNQEKQNIVHHREIRSVDKKILNADGNENSANTIPKIAAEDKSDDICDKENEIPNARINKEASTYPPLIKMITKLSDPELVSVKLSHLDSLNVDSVLKPLKRDLKSYKATKRK